MMKIFAAAALAASLAACDFHQAGTRLHQWAGLAAHSPTIVLPPGFKVILAGQTAFVSGFEECPKADPAMAALFGSAPRQDGCVVVRKDAAAVDVHVALGGRLLRERWTIERSSASGSAPFDRTHLRRPDGSLVQQAPSAR
jgi:hypothetical protein